MKNFRNPFGPIFDAELPLPPGITKAADNVGDFVLQFSTELDTLDWFDIPEGDDTSDEGDTFGEFAGARPAHAGGGTKDTTDSKGAGGKGGGKNKNTDTGTDTTTDPTTDSGTGSGGDTTTDTGTGTDSGPSSNYVTADFTSGLDTPGGYNISVIYSGSWTDAVIAKFESALEIISDFITGDVADTNTSFGMVDDILIYANMGTIDGSGGYIGWGSVAQIRTEGDNLASVGSITLDKDDQSLYSDASYFEDFVVHEVLHAMGFGTLWSYAGLVETINGQLRFTGQNATEAYNTEFADIAAADADSWLGVPVEMEGGSGTAGVHWDDATFTDEVMTGRLNWTNVISDMTLASLADMGYQTTYGDALLG
jgi:hypothetical protein